MKDHALEAIVQRLAGAGVGTFEYTGHGTHILLRFGPSSAGAGGQASAPAAIPAAKTSAIVALRVGLFLTRHPLDADPLVSAGSAVKRGQLVAFVAVDDKLHAVYSPEDGVLGPVLVEPGTLVGYGEKLFAFDPAGPS